MKEDPSHVVAVPLMMVVHMAVVVEVWRMPGRMVRLEVVVVAKLVVRGDGGNRQRVLRLQARVCRMQEGVGWRVHLDLEGLVAGVQTCSGGCGGCVGMIVGIVG